MSPWWHMCVELIGGSVLGPETTAEDSWAGRIVGGFLNLGLKPDAETGFRFKENWYHAAFQLSPTTPSNHTTTVSKVTYIFKCKWVHYSLLCS